MTIQRITIDGGNLPDRFVSRETAAEFLGLSVATLATWASDGHGPTFTKLSAGRSGAVRYRLSELEKFAANPTAYRPRPVAKFNPACLKQRGNQRINVMKARRRKGKGVRGI